MDVVLCTADGIKKSGKLLFAVRKNRNLIVIGKNCVVGIQQQGRCLLKSFRIQGLSMILIPAFQLFPGDIFVHNIRLGFLREDTCTVQVPPEEHIDNDTDNREDNKCQNPGHSHRRILAFQKNHGNTECNIQQKKQQCYWDICIAEY